MSQRESSRASNAGALHDSFSRLAEEKGLRRRQQDWAEHVHTLAGHLSDGRFVVQPHHVLISSTIETARRAIICAPPRHGKSEEVSHWFPVWLLNRNPALRIMLCGYGDNFAALWGRKVRDEIQAHKHQLRVRVRDDVSAAGEWETTAGGGMLTAGIGGQIVGRGADVLIVDDYCKNMEEAYSETYRDRTWEWWTGTARTRLEPGGRIIIMATRWHHDDLIGRLLRQGKDEWQRVVLPALAEEEDPLGRVEGEALWPERYPSDELDSIRNDVGPRVWNSQFQQRPSPEEGSLFKRADFRFYRESELPEKLDMIILSIDAAFKASVKSDFVVLQVWGAVGAARYLLDQRRGRMTFTATVEAIKSLRDQWEARGVNAVVVEEAANGAAIIDTLQRDISGLVAIRPEGSKEARAAAVSPHVEAHQVYLPEESWQPWVVDLLDELAAFPNGPNDDQVDALTQALRYLQAHSVAHVEGFRVEPKPGHFRQPVPEQYRPARSMFGFFRR